MGQPNTKEMRRKARSSAQSNVGGNATRMDSTNAIRQAAYTDTLLQPTERNNSNEQQQQQEQQQFKESHNRSNGNGNSNSNNDDNNGISPVYGSPNQRISRPAGASGTSRPNTTALDNNTTNNKNKQNVASGRQGNYHVDPTRMSNIHSSVGAENNLQSVAHKTYPIVFRYTDRDVQVLLEKKKNVGVMVETLNWQVWPMSASTDSFYALLKLPPGHHNYRFVIDGHELIDRTQPLAPTKSNQSLSNQTSQTRYSEGNLSYSPHDGTLPGVHLEAPLPRPTPPRDGKPANMVYLNEVLLTTREDDDIMDDGSGWGQEPIVFEESRKYPPMMPVHLRYTPLNTPPTLFRGNNNINNNNNNISIYNNNNNSNSVLNVNESYRMLTNPSNNRMTNINYDSNNNNIHTYRSNDANTDENNALDNTNIALAEHHTEFNSYTDFLHSQPIDNAGELPIPLSVTINHVYFQRRDDHAVIGVTTRYCNKFTTVVYYSHLPQSISGGTSAIQQVK